MLLASLTVSSIFLSGLREATGSQQFHYPASVQMSATRRVLDWDYDGRRILGHIGNDVCVWDSKTGRLLMRLKGHQNSLVAVQFSPDHSLALSSALDYDRGIGVQGEMSVRLWDLDKRKEVRRLDDAMFGQFSPDGKQILVRLLAKDATGRYHDANRLVAQTSQTKSGEVLLEFETDAKQSYLGLNALAFSADGGRILALSRGGAIATYRARDGKYLGKLSEDKGENACYRVSRWTTQVLVCKSSGNEVWNAESATLIRAFPGKSADNWRPADADFADKGKAIVRVENESVGMWNVKSGERIRSLPVPGRPTRVIASPDGDRCVIEWQKSGSDPLNAPIIGAMLWDTSTGEFTLLDVAGEAPWFLGFSPDGRTLLAGGELTTIYDAKNGKVLSRASLEGLNSSQG